MTHRAAIIACARDETAYIAEWLTYHRAIGFGHVFLYCNDDDPGPLFAAVLPFLQGPDPFVTFHHYPLQGEQFRMYLHALAHYRGEAEWIAFLDIDEFLALRDGGSLDDLLDAIPPDQGCLLLHWLMFGPNGHATPPPGGVVEIYTRRAARVWASTKTLTRSACIALDRIDRRIFFWHRWEGSLVAGAASRSVLGLDPAAMPADRACLTDPAMTEAILSRAAVHHYAFRSEAALAQRVARGLGGDFHGQEMWQRALAEGTAAAQMAEMNAVEDRFLAEFWAGWRTRRIAPGLLLPRPLWPNLACGRTATQSSVGAFSLGATVEEDAAGVVSGRLTGSFQCHTDGEAAPFWQVDLGVPAQVHEIRVFNRLDNPVVAARLRRFAIDTSSDGRHWMRVCRKSDDTPVGGMDARPFRFLPATPVPARLVRLRLTEPGALHLDQVEVYGEPAAGGSGR
ncbi:MAG: glycosyltransferase family 2 protein [Acetobacteraceae bacterium]